MYYQVKCQRCDVVAVRGHELCEEHVDADANVLHLAWAAVLPIFFSASAYVVSALLHFL